jgi:YbbR domain-containing protein
MTALRRFAGIIVHNWPLKLAAVVLATLLYAGLVATQDTTTFPGRIPVTAANQPANSIITNQLKDVERIGYIAPANLGPLRADDFHPTVDLRGIEPDGTTRSVRVDVTAPPGVTIVSVFPSSIQVTLDKKTRRTLKVTLVQNAPPAGIAIGDAVLEPAEVELTGASAAVNRVAVVQVSVSIDGSGVYVDRDIQPDALDANGSKVAGVQVTPALVHVTVPVFTNLRNRTLPVNPVITGTPGAGFRIAAVKVDPQTVTVEGDLEQIQDLVSADTEPVAVSGATRTVIADVGYGLPTGVSAVGAGTARVTVTIEAVTETRTFEAGLRLDGRDPALDYQLGDKQVLLTLFGSTADLDRLNSSPIVIAIDVGKLEPGTHEVPVVPALSSAVTVAAISPETVTITVTTRPTPSPVPTATAAAGASGEPPAGPSPTTAP